MREEGEGDAVLSWVPGESRAVSVSAGKKGAGRELSSGSRKLKSHSKGTALCTAGTALGKSRVCLFPMDTKLPYTLLTWHWVVKDL